MIEKKFSRRITLTVISFAFVLVALLTTSCKPKYDKFPIDDVNVESADQLDAPIIARVMVAGNLEGKRVTLVWAAPRA